MSRQKPWRCPMCAGSNIDYDVGHDQYVDIAGRLIEEHQHVCRDCDHFMAICSEVVESNDDE